MSNYGEKHFGVSVFEYFPWYSYPDSLTEQPKLSRYYTLYRSVIEFNMSSVWHGDVSYLLTGGGGQFTKESPSFLIDRIEKTLNQKQSVEGWLDVEKLRLITNLGLKSDAEKYINNLDRLKDFIEVIEDGELDYDREFDIDVDFSTISSKSLVSEGIVRLTDEEVINYIKKYNGDVDFYTGLKNYLTKNGELTWRQIQAVKKKPPTGIFNLPDFCLIIRNPKISRLITPRLSNMGYKIINETIVY